MVRCGFRRGQAMSDALTVVRNSIQCWRGEIQSYGVSYW